MKILLINHYAGSLRHGMEYRPYYLAREWARAGHSVTIVASSFSHVRSMNADQSEVTREERLDGIRYLWLRGKPYFGNGFGRIRNMLHFLYRLYRIGARLADEKPDVVIASSTYPLDMFPAARIARRARAKLVFEVHDLWPLSPMELGGMSRWHPFIAVMQIGEDYAYRRADKVISLLPKAREHMLSRGMAPEKYAYIPNGIALEEWADSGHDSVPEPLKSECARLRAEGKFLIGYAGAHGVANALDHLLDAASSLKNERISFLLIGKGPEKSRLMERAVREKIDNVRFFDPIPKIAIPSALRGFDALFIALEKKGIYRFGTSLNKVMDYMMSGRPLLYSGEAANDPVRESGCGVSVAAENPAKIAEGARDLLGKSPAQLAEMGARGTAYVREHHDYSALARRFLEALS